MPITLFVASGDEQLRDLVRENLLNFPDARVAAEYADVPSNLYISVLQDLERYPDAALLIDLSTPEPDEALKILERIRQAAPWLYIIAAGYSSEGEAIISVIRAGANDYLLLPLRRADFRDALHRLERTPRQTAHGESRLGRIYSFLGAKGGVGTTTLAVNFASVLAQRKKSTVLIDLDLVANDVAMQLGATPQYTLANVAENLERMDQALFEGFVARDPLGFFFVGPPDNLDDRGYLQEGQFQQFASFLVEKYEAVVVDAGRNPTEAVVLEALQASSAVFLVLNQEFPALRNAQRYLAFLMRLGFSQDQIRIVVNFYSKRSNSNYLTLDHIQQTLNQPVFYGLPPTPAMLAAVNKGRPIAADRQLSPDFDKAFRAFVDKATGSRKAAAATQSNPS